MDALSKKPKKWQIARFVVKEIGSVYRSTSSNSASCQDILFETPTGNH